MLQMIHSLHLHRLKTDHADNKLVCNLSVLGKTDLLQICCRSAGFVRVTIQHAKTLQNSEICNEIDTTTPRSQLEIHTSAFGTLTAAKEEGTNQTSYGGFFIS